MNDENTDKEYTEFLQAIPSDELLSFLATKMNNEVSFQNELKSQFPMHFEIDVQSYIYEWQSIVEDAEDRSGFIDYDHGFDFEYNVSKFWAKYNR